MELNINVSVNEISEKELEKQIRKFMRNINHVGKIQECKVLIVDENKSKSIKQVLQQ